MELDSVIIFAISGTHLTCSFLLVIRYFSLSFSAAVTNSLNLSSHKVFTIVAMILVYLLYTYASVPLPAGILVVVILRQIAFNIRVLLSKLHDVPDCQILQIWHFNYLEFLAQYKLYEGLVSKQVLSFLL